MQNKCKPLLKMAQAGKSSLSVRQLARVHSDWERPSAVLVSYESMNFASCGHKWKNGAMSCANQLLGANLKARYEQEFLSNMQAGLRIFTTWLELRSCTCHRLNATFLPHKASQFATTRLQFRRDSLAGASTAGLLEAP